MTTHPRPLTQAEHADSVRRFREAIDEALAELRADNPGPGRVALLDKVADVLLTTLIAKLGDPQA